MINNSILKAFMILSFLLFLVNINTLEDIPGFEDIKNSIVAGINDHRIFYTLYFMSFEGYFWPLGLEIISRAM